MSRPKWVFAGVAIVAIAWTGWLIYMAKTVGKPVVVSAPQLHFATIVVSAQVTVQGEMAQAKIIKVFKDDRHVKQAPLPETITVQWSPNYKHATEQPMLLALIPSQAGAAPASYEVAPIPRPDRLLPPVVYPCTDSVRIQTERVLGTK